MDYKFNKAEKADFVRFWQSDVGKKYLDKCKASKEDLLEHAMRSPEAQVSHFFAAAANGVDTILADIDAIINNKEEEEKTAKKTS